MRIITTITVVIIVVLVTTTVVTVVDTDTRLRAEWVVLREEYVF